MQDALADIEQKALTSEANFHYNQALRQQTINKKLFTIIIIIIIKCPNI